jgi:hypothetical protein
MLRYECYILLDGLSLRLDNEGTEQLVELILVDGLRELHGGLGEELPGCIIKYKNSHLWFGIQHTVCQTPL